MPVERSWADESAPGTDFADKNVHRHVVGSRGPSLPEARGKEPAFALGKLPE
jgi:hypothetical protein